MIETDYQVEVTLNGSIFVNSDTPEQVRDKLMSLAPALRLSLTYLKDVTAPNVYYGEGKSVYQKINEIYSEIPSSFVDFVMFQTDGEGGFWQYTNSSFRVPPGNTVYFEERCSIIEPYTKFEWIIQPSNEPSFKLLRRYPEYTFDDINMYTITLRVLNYAGVIIGQKSKYFYCNIPTLINQKHFIFTNQNGQAIEGVTVTVLGEGESKQTDSSGVVTFQLVDGDYSYTAEATGYATVSGTFTMEGTDDEEVVTMNTLLFDKTFEVTGDGGLPVSGAVIRLGAVTGITDDDGLYVFTDVAYALQVPYSVTADDYLTYSSLVDVTSSDTTEVSLSASARYCTVIITVVSEGNDVAINNAVVTLGDYAEKTINGIATFGTVLMGVVYEGHVFADNFQTGAFQIDANSPMITRTITLSYADSGGMNIGFFTIAPQIGFDDEEHNLILSADLGHDYVFDEFDTIEISWETSGLLNTVTLIDESKAPIAGVEMDGNILIVNNPGFHIPVLVDTVFTLNTVLLNGDEGTKSVTYYAVEKVVIASKSLISNGITEVNGVEVEEFLLTITLGNYRPGLYSVVGTVQSSAFPTVDLNFTTTDTITATILRSPIEEDYQVYLDLTQLITMIDKRTIESQIILSPTAPSVLSTTITPSVDYYSNIGRNYTFLVGLSSNIVEAFVSGVFVIVDLTSYEVLPANYSFIDDKTITVNLDGVTFTEEHNKSFTVKIVYSGQEILATTTCLFYDLPEITAFNVSHYGSPNTLQINASLNRALVNNFTGSLNNVSISKPNISTSVISFQQSALPLVLSSGGNNITLTINENIIGSRGENVQILAEDAVVMYSTTFTILSSGVPLENAGGTMNSSSDTSDASGVAVIDSLTNGTYGYSVNLNGYEDSTGSVEILNADVDLTVSLTATAVAHTVYYGVVDSSIYATKELALAHLIESGSTYPTISTTTLSRFAVTNPTPTTDGWQFVICESDELFGYKLNNFFDTFENVTWYHPAVEPVIINGNTHYIYLSKQVISNNDGKVMEYSNQSF